MENEVITQAVEQNADSKEKKKKEKVRSAWISFAGRIVAQLVGAIATVALGVMVLHRYTSADEQRPGRSNAAVALEAQPPAAPAQQPAVHVIVLTPGMLGSLDAERFAAVDRPCTSRIDTPKTSAAHLDHGTLVSR